ncbi:MAG: alpha/beta fold hydrolase [Thermoleophilia bacterium]|nr:alpha/beta fold hydrolase [Thermoleophilia bacterium]
MAATPLVLLHPYPVDAGFWDPVRALLRPGRPVLAPEAPGFGAAPAEPGWTVTGYADAVAARIADWAPGGRAAVCGLSLGGYVALAIAARHPERLSALVLADTRAEPDDDAALAARADGIARIEMEGTVGYLRDFLPRAVSPAAAPEARAALAALAGRQPAGALCDALRALAGRVDRRPDLPAVACPALVIVGEDDAATPPAAARVIADGIPDARLEIIPAAGHMTALERPERFAALLEEHLAPTGRDPGDV